MYNAKSQRKTSQAVQLKTRAAAPPVYRPNPVPRVCQLKRATPQPRVIAGNRVAPPPVYRPQPVAKVLQRRVVNQPPSNLRQPVQATTAPRAKVIQRNINSTHFEKSAAVDPLYMVDRLKRDTLYSKTTAPPPRPRGLYSKKADTDDATGAQVYAWKPNVRFLSRAEMRFDRDTRRYPVDGGHRVLDVPELFREIEEAHDPGAIEQPIFGILGKNDCTSFAQALHFSIARENYQAGDDEELYEEREADYPDLRVGDMMVHQLNTGAAGWHGVTVVAEHGNRQVVLEADVRRDSTVPQFHIQQGVAGFVDFNIGQSAETSRKVAVTRYVRGAPKDSDLRRYQTAMTADPLTLVGGAVTSRRINPDVFLPLGHLIHNQKWNTEGKGWFGSAKTPDGVVKMRAAYGRRHYLEVFRIADAKNKTEDSDRSPLVRDLYEYLSEVWNELKLAAARSLDAYPSALRQHMADIGRWSREISSRR